MTRKEAERQESINQLREWLKPGDTVFTVLRHVSRSGMSRLIDCYIIEGNEAHWISSRVAKAVGFSFDDKKDSIRVGGCGMDMGFHIVYELSHVLFPKGFECIGDKEGNRCPANDHCNGDRNYTPHLHEHAGGYALRHRWM